MLFGLVHFSTHDMPYIFSFAKEFGHRDWQGYGSFIHRWTKRYGIVNRAISGSKELAAPLEELEAWKETVLLSTLSGYSPNDIYKGDETAEDPWNSHALCCMHTNHGKEVLNKVMDC